MKLVFICGRFRAETLMGIEKNIYEARTMALRLWKEGFAVICPHANTGLSFYGAADEKVFLKGDLEILARCDAVMLVGNYARSYGALKEIELATKKKMPIFYNVERLLEWSRKLDTPPGLC